MAQFRARIRGQRGEASRLGSRRSGIVARVDGWRSGVRVEGICDRADGSLDHFDIYSTNGSGSDGSSCAGVVAYLGRVLLVDGKVTFEPA